MLQSSLQIFPSVVVGRPLKPRRPPLWVLLVNHPVQQRPPVLVPLRFIDPAAHCWRRGRQCCRRAASTAEIILVMPSPAVRRVDCWSSRSRTPPQPSRLSAKPEVRARRSSSFLQSRHRPPARAPPSRQSDIAQGACIAYLGSHSDPWLTEGEQSLFGLHAPGSQTHPAFLESFGAGIELFPKRVQQTAQRRLHDHRRPALWPGKEAWSYFALGDSHHRNTAQSIYSPSARESFSSEGICCVHVITALIATA